MENRIQMTRFVQLHGFCDYIQFASALVYTFHVQEISYFYITETSSQLTMHKIFLLLNTDKYH